MVAENGYKTYLNSHYEGMEPKRLVFMLYKGALQHLQFARQGIEEKDIKKRGEHLSRAIAIVSELNTSLDPNVKDESIEFLRGLYNAILLELPKVSITNDIKTIDLSISYLSSLKDIWEKGVLKENQQNRMQKAHSDKKQKSSTTQLHSNSYNSSIGYGEQSLSAGIRSFSV